MTKTTLPQPPEFPVSNASYNKIVGRMHKAALNAATSEAAIAAVTAIRDHVRGTNTYAKATRKYAGQLLDALVGLTDEKVAEMESAIETAAAGGDPLASFMLKGQKAQAAVDAVLADPKKLEIDPSKHPGGITATGKTFSNRSNAKRGLKTNSLDHLPVDFLKTGNGDEVMPVLSAADDKAAAYIAERGFAYRVLA